MSDVVVLTIDELRRVIHDEVSRAVRPLVPVREPKSDSMTIDKTVEFLAENGMPLSKSYIYILSSKGHIPCKKRNNGKSLIFSRKELGAWIDLKAAKGEKGIKNIVKSANKQL